MTDPLSITIAPEALTAITSEDDSFFLIGSPGESLVVGVLEDEPTTIHSYSDMPIVRSAAGAGESIELRQEIASSNWVFGHSLG